MSALTIRQRAQLQAAAHRDALAAEQLKHSTSSTPFLQRFIDSGAGVCLLLFVGLALFAVLAPLGRF